MMKYIECPADSSGNGKSLFIAGGITGCSDWQAKFVKLLNKCDIALLNPRRKNFSMMLNLEEEQITWEFEHLKKATVVSFWFPNETLCPIALYELGRESAGNRPIFIGIDPNYKRRKDVEIQIRLTRPDIRIVYSLEELAAQVRKWCST